MATIGQYAIGAFLALHGLVHAWYVVLSQGWVEVEEAMGWNGQSWLLSGVLEPGPLLNLASVGYVLVALGFVAGGAGYAVGTDWWEPVLVATAVASTLLLVAMWDGRFDLLVEKGVLGVFINLVVLGWVLFLE